jgi:pyruvate,water dikinase
VLLAVVVQRMVVPEASGIMFTADPISGRRKTVCIDASFGLGEALVAGLVTANLYQVRAGTIVTKRVSRKVIAIRPLPDGGTVTETLPPEEQERQALPDNRILELAGLGLRIEEHYGREQDIEWCLGDGKFFIVQARPITSLYPAPRAADGRLHLYASFGHVQMMTEAMKPLGISALRTFVPVGDRSPSGESELFQDAGGRLFVDLNPVLRYRRLRYLVPRVLPLADERIARAVAEFLEREEYRAALRPEKRLELSFALKAAPFLFSVLRTFLLRNPGRGVKEIERAMEELIAERHRRVEEARGAERIRRIRSTLRSLFPDLVGRNVLQNVLPGVIAFRLIENLSKRWLGDTAELASLGRSPPGNVTTEMGLALGDVADVVRAHPGAIERLRRATDESFDRDLREIAGGEEVHRAFAAFLERYGMRCTGEIDITRRRWREAPTQPAPPSRGTSGAELPGSTAAILKPARWRQNGPRPTCSNASGRRGVTSSRHVRCGGSSPSTVPGSGSGNIPSTTSSGSSTSRSGRSSRKGRGSSGRAPCDRRRGGLPAIGGRGLLVLAGGARRHPSNPAGGPRGP